MVGLWHCTLGSHSPQPAPQCSEAGSQNLAVLEEQKGRGGENVGMGLDLLGER